MNANARKLYQFIREYSQAKQCPPTYREMAIGCHLGQSTVRYHLQVLEGEGYVRREKGRARSIFLTRKPLPKN